MKKETIQVTFAPRGDPRLATVKAPEFDGSSGSLKAVKKEIRRLKKSHPDILIEVSTPKITGTQLKTLFDAGAMASRTLSPTEEEKEAQTTSGQERPLSSEVSRYIDHVRETAQAEPIKRNGETWVWVSNCSLNGSHDQRDLPLLIDRWRVRLLIDQPSTKGLSTDQGMYVNAADFSLYKWASDEIMEGKRGPSERYWELLASVGEEEERREYLATEGRKIIEEIARRTKERIIREALQRGRGFWQGGIFYISFGNVPREDASGLEALMRVRGLSVIFQEGATGAYGRKLPNCLRLFVNLDQKEEYRRVHQKYLDLERERLART